MFEEEAKKHKEEFITTYINIGGGLKAADMIGMQKEQSYQEGAEFGYNKAMEWHFVKDGEYPTHSISNCHVSQAEKRGKMKRMLWCVHHIIIDSDGYYESIKACSSKEKAEKIARSIRKGKTFIRPEEKEI